VLLLCTTTIVADGRPVKLFSLDGKLWFQCLPTSSGFGSVAVTNLSGAAFVPDSLL